MNMPLWLQMLSTKRYNQRQQAVLDEIAELQARRLPTQAKNNNVYSELCKKHESN
ncbi:hypothetical protein hairong_150 [Pseudomonas phage hairong]|nr:hypothetical protein hairong_150 [Pseudomonas phage hairong]